MASAPNPSPPTPPTGSSFGIRHLTVVPANHADADGDEDAVPAREES